MTSSSSNWQNIPSLGVSKVFSRAKPAKTNLVPHKRYDMSRLLLGLMLLVTAGAASAEWTRIGETDKLIQYVDRATIRRNGNFVKMWDLSDYKTVEKSAGESYLSSKAQSEYNCKEEKVRLLALTLFDGKIGRGKVVYSNGNVKDEWEPIEPGSIAEILWKIACGKQ